MGTLLGMLHGHDDLFRSDDQVHGAAHTGHHFPRYDPVGQVSALVHLQGSQYRDVHMASPDDAEGGGAVKEHGPLVYCHILGSRIDDVHIFLALFRSRSHAHDAVFRLEYHVHSFGNEVGYHGGQADSQIHHVSVL